jgi:hypothetical protein
VHVNVAEVFSLRKEGEILDFSVKFGVKRRRGAACSFAKFVEFRLRKLVEGAGMSLEHDHQPAENFRRVPMFEVPEPAFENARPGRDCSLTSVRLATKALLEWQHRGRSIRAPRIPQRYWAFLC